jgi:hypothetical protein
MAGKNRRSCLWNSAKRHNGRGFYGVSRAGLRGCRSLAERLSGAGLKVEHASKAVTGIWTPFLAQSGHKFEGRPGGPAGQGAGVVQRLWSRVGMWKRSLHCACNRAPSASHTLRLPDRLFGATTAATYSRRRSRSGNAGGWRGRRRQGWSGGRNLRMNERTPRRFGEYCPRRRRQPA